MTRPEIESEVALAFLEWRQGPSLRDHDPEQPRTLAALIVRRIDERLNGRRAFLRVTND